MLYDLLDYLKSRPVRGRAPKRTLIYGHTFAPRPGDNRYNAALGELIGLIGATALAPGRPESDKVTSWFVPPIVVPAFLISLVMARAAYVAYF